MKSAFCMLGSWGSPSCAQEFFSPFVSCVIDSLKEFTQDDKLCPLTALTARAWLLIDPYLQMEPETPAASVPPSHPADYIYIYPLFGDFYIEELLGYHYRDEMIHRDNLVLL